MFLPLIVQLFCSKRPSSVEPILLPHHNILRTSSHTCLVFCSVLYCNGVLGLSFKTGEAEDALFPCQICRLRLLLTFPEPQINTLCRFSQITPWISRKWKLPVLRDSFGNFCLRSRQWFPNAGILLIFFYRFVTLLWLRFCRASCRNCRPHDLAEVFCWTNIFICICIYLRRIETSWTNECALTRKKWFCFWVYSSWQTVMRVSTPRCLAQCLREKPLSPIREFSVENWFERAKCWCATVSTSVTN